MKNKIINLSQNNTLSEKKVMITGSTSGIGRALALLLWRNGSFIIAHGRSLDSLHSLSSVVNNKNIQTVKADLSKSEDLQIVESTILDVKPDVLVLNAGYNCRKAYSSEWSNSEISEMLMVNLISHIHFSRTFIGLPILKVPRRLVIILSTSCHYPREKMSLYIASKTGLMGFGKVLQQEAHHNKVRTTLFYPGRTNSSFRNISNSKYMSPESVAVSILSILNLPCDVVPYEFIFRPKTDINI